MVHFTTGDRTETIRRLTITAVLHMQSFTSCRVLRWRLPPATAYAQLGRCEGEPLSVPRGNFVPKPILNYSTKVLQKRCAGRNGLATCSRRSIVIPRRHPYTIP
jgi:hypothetical protein